MFFVGKPTSFLQPCWIPLPPVLQPLGKASSPTFLPFFQVYFCYLFSSILSFFYSLTLWPFVFLQPSTLFFWPSFSSTTCIVYIASFDFLLNTQMPHNHISSFIDLKLELYCYFLVICFMIYFKKVWFALFWTIIIIHQCPPYEIL